MLQFIKHNLIALLIGVMVAAFAAMLFMRSPNMEVCGTVIKNEPVLGESWEYDACYLTIRTDSVVYRVRGSSNQSHAAVGSFICIATSERFITQMP